MSEAKTYGWPKRALEHVPKNLSLDAAPAFVRVTFASLLLAALLGSTWMLVFYTGGTKYAYVHAFYIPILAASLLFGVPGGVLAGVLAGILCGPYMPLDTNTGEMQQAASWMSRAGFFVLMGGLGGAMVASLKKQNQLIKKRGRLSLRTGFSNRFALEEDIDTQIRSGLKKPNHTFLIAEVGISDLEQIIETYGHRVTNQLLVQVGDKLKNSLPLLSTVYHLQGDRFAVLPFGLKTKGINECCDVLINAVKKPTDVEGVSILLNACIGVAQYPAHGNNGEELCRASRFAVRRAETTREKYAIFDKAHASQKIEILQRLTKLREAIAGDELIFHYQPKLDLRTKEISSVEALVRWPQASGEILSPAAFIPAAEGTALITQLSAWGLQTAVRQLAHWQKDKVHTDLRIAVNLSALDLRDDNTVRLIKEFLALYGVNASRLEIEVTETTIIDDLPAATRCLEQIKELGVHIAIDDFGTGHAGLVQLKNLPVHSLKIDQTFVKNMLTDSKDRQIVRSAIDLGHNLGLEIIAEGVESKEVLAELGQYGCDIVQGYGIARPLPEAALRTWLKSRPPL